MIFATGLGSPCGECLRILQLKGVAEGVTAECYHCRYGIKIAGGNRVYTEPTKKQDKTEVNENISVFEKIAESDRELE